MTISSTSFKTTITTSGSTGSFDVPFRLNNSSELVVIKLSTASVESTYSSTQFAVAGTFPSSTGTFTITSRVDVLSSTNESFLVKRIVPTKQGVDLTPAGSLPAESIEEGLDNLMMAIQQLDESLSRSVTLAPTSTISDLRLPSPSSGRTFQWSTSNTLVNVTLASSTAVSISTFAESLLDDISEAAMRDTIDAMGATATVTANRLPVFDSTSGALLRQSGSINVSTLDQLYGHYGRVSTASTGNFTISSSENGMVMRCASTSNTTITVPASSATLLTMGWQAVFARMSTFTLQFAMAATVDTLASNSSQVFIRNQYESASLIRMSGSSTASVWLLAGSLSTS